MIFTGVRFRGGWKGKVLWGREKCSFFGLAEIFVGVEIVYLELLWGYFSFFYLVVFFWIWVRSLDDFSRSGVLEGEFGCFGVVRLGRKFAGVLFFLFWILYIFYRSLGSYFFCVVFIVGFFIGVLVN